MIQRWWFREVIEGLVSWLIGEDKYTEVETMLEGHSDDGFEESGKVFKMNILEEESHNESVNETHLAAVLETVAESFKHSFYFFF